MSTKLSKAGAKDVSIPAGEFKAKCLALLDRVESDGQSFVVTKRGRPVARIVPLPKERPTTLVGSLLHEDDLLAPVRVRWEASTRSRTIHASRSSSSPRESR